MWIEDDVICRNDAIPEPEIHLDRKVSVYLEVGSDGVIPEPEVSVDVIRP